MQDQRTCSVAATDARRVEAQILALLLAEDSPWREQELAQRANAPLALVRACVARLQADGLVTNAQRAWPHNRAANKQPVRASRAAVRAHELIAADATSTHV